MSVKALQLEAAECRLQILVKIKSYDIKRILSHA